MPGGGTPPGSGGNGGGRVSAVVDERIASALERIADALEALLAESEQQSDA